MVNSTENGRGPRPPPKDRSAEMKKAAAAKRRMVGEERTAKILVRQVER